MLANKDIFKEIEVMEAVRDSLKSDYEKAMVKGQVLQVKLLHNMRTNMVAVMKAMKEKGFNIEMVVPKFDATTTTIEKK
jgi:hypothetical protein